MYNPSLKEFLRLSKKANVIPVYKQISADLDTPVSAFLKIKRDDYAFLLESVEGQEKVARYSFLGSNPSFIFSSKGRNVRIEYPLENKKRSYVTKDDPLEEVRRLMRGFKALNSPGLPRFFGGLVGYMGYDMVRFFEDIPDDNPDDLKFADCVFMLTDNILIFDHVSHTIKIVNNLIIRKDDPSRREKIRLYKEAIKKIEAVHDRLKGAPIKKVQKKRGDGKIKIFSNFKKAQFEDIVHRAKKYIKRGDIIQVVLSQRFGMKLGDREPFDIYRALRSLNPSPYMFFLKLKDVVLAGSSPEMLVRCEDGIVQTRPIAGTRRRGRDIQEDKRLADELINDKKERAEHIMLVDLGRNDLGRVCKMGSVEVNEFMSVERYSHVMHLVSEARGRLRKGFDAYDALRACFPAGTVSGSPKIRAMEIIDELENIKRGPYAGCVGYFSFSHNLDACITIRTIVIKDDTVYVQAGAGIVADSKPQKEYFESVNKAKALIEAVTMS